MHWKSRASVGFCSACPGSDILCSRIFWWPVKEAVSFSPFQLLPCVIILLKPLFLGICVCTSDSEEVKLTLLPEKHTAMTEFLLPSEVMCQEWDSWFWVIAIESILSQECYYTRFCKWLRTGRSTTSTMSQPPSVPTESTRKTPTVWTVWHYLKSTWGCG